ncbi:MAG TPA: tail fiber protein [Anaerolineales bacterium]|nr:tail fiber protein [Anaerolineales bacterium]
MSQPFIGEIRIFGGNFAPAGWAFCNGQLMPISENDALFTLIGTTYGGDGQETFGLPDLQGRLPMHMGTGGGLSPRTIGEQGGVETVTLTINQIPNHSHVPLAVAGNGNQSTPQGGVWAGVTTSIYTSNPPNLAFNATLGGSTGGSQPHENLMPYLAVSFIISLFGIFPTQN